MKWLKSLGSNSKSTEVLRIVQDEAIRRAVGCMRNDGRRAKKALELAAKVQNELYASDDTRLDVLWGESSWDACREVLHQKFGPDEIGSRTDISYGLYAKVWKRGKEAVLVVSVEFGVRSRSDCSLSVFYRTPQSKLIEVPRTEGAVGLAIIAACREIELVAHIQAR